MASYQDLEVRMNVLEDKMDFLLRTFTITKRTESMLAPGQVIVETKNLLDVYRELKNQGALILPAGLEASKPEAPVEAPVGETDGVV